MGLMRKLPLITAAALLALAGCSSANETSSTEATTVAAGDTISIVTSTQIWADIANEVVSPQDAEITAIITGNTSDPHHFEPTAQDIALAKQADLVLVGGGGYDAWLSDVVDSSKVLSALDPHAGHAHSEGAHAEESDAEGAEDVATTAEAHAEESVAEESHSDEDGHSNEDSHSHSHDGEANEHIWYNLHEVEHFATHLAERVTELKPDATVSTTSLAEKLEPLEARLAALPAAKVAQTETVGEYLVEASQLEDVTPAGFRQATLNHSEVSAADLAAFLDLIAHDEVDIVLLNPQTQTDTTTRIREAAEDASIQVVEIYETPAAGEDYFTFVSAAVDHLEAAAKQAAVK